MSTWSTCVEELSLSLYVKFGVLGFVTRLKAERSVILGDMNSSELHKVLSREREARPGSENKTEDGHDKAEERERHCR